MITLSGYLLDYSVIYSLAGEGRRRTGENCLGGRGDLWVIKALLYSSEKPGDVSEES